MRQRPLKPFWFSVELLVDRLIPYLLVILLIIVFLDLFTDYLLVFAFEIEVFDIFIIVVFGLDLIFKYLWAKGQKGFIRKYWIDILAIIPFFLVFRLAEGILLATEEAGIRVQRLVHLGAEAEKEVVVLTEAEKLEKLSRLSRIQKILRPVSRSPRFMKAFSFYEHPLARKKHHAKR